MFAWLVSNVASGVGSTDFSSACLVMEFYVTFSVALLWRVLA